MTMLDPSSTEDRLSAPPSAVPDRAATAVGVLPEADAAAGSSRASDLLAKLGPMIGLAFVFTLFTVLTTTLHRSTFASYDNMQLILLQTAVVGTAALGMTLIIVSGGIDLSVGSNIALGTVVIARLLQNGFPPIVAALGGVLVGAACGLFISTLITRLNLSPFVVTLGMWGALRGAAKGLAAEQTVSLKPEMSDRLNDSWIMNLLNELPAGHRWMIFPSGVWMLIVLAVIVAMVLRYTRFGRHIFAVGSNENTARLCGINVNTTKLAIYTLGAAFVGLAALLQFSYLTLGDPTTADGMELNIIAAVVIGGASLSGGQGSIFGTLIGAVIMTMVANGCTKLDLSNWVQQIVTGGIIIFAVALDRLRHRGTS